MVFHLQRRPIAPIAVPGAYVREQPLARAGDHLICCSSDRQHQVMQASGAIPEHRCLATVVHQVGQQVKDLRVGCCLAFPLGPSHGLSSRA
jgi:hypothetical protein